jgi:hypothetical protein
MGRKDLSESPVRGPAVHPGLWEARGAGRVVLPCPRPPPRATWLLPGPSAISPGRPSTVTGGPKAPSAVPGGPIAAARLSRAGRISRSSAGIRARGRGLGAPAFYGVALDPGHAMARRPTYFSVIAAPWCHLAPSVLQCHLAPSLLQCHRAPPVRPHCRRLEPAPCAGQARAGLVRGPAWACAWPVPAQNYIDTGIIRYRRAGSNSAIRTARPSSNLLRRCAWPQARSSPAAAARSPQPDRPGRVRRAGPRRPEPGRQRRAHYGTVRA